MIPEIEIEVKYKKKVKKSERIQITSSQYSAQAFRQIFNADTIDWREEAVMLCLNRANEIVGFYKISSGGMAGTVIDPKIVFTIALGCAASGIILAHNHPSGALKPSDADMAITQKLKEGGKLLEITLLDHLIITSESHLSFLDEGLL